MKNIISAAFCLLLAGSAIVQSCKKPDDTSDPAVPIIPVVPPVVPPIDSVMTDTPSVPLTEQQIILKALDKLGSDTFIITGYSRIIRRTTKMVAGISQSYFEDYLSNSPRFIAPVPNPVWGKDGLIAIANRPRTGVIRNNLNYFYNKIFVNANGDKFIGSIQLPRNPYGSNDRLADSAYITAAEFNNLQKYNTIAIDSNALFSFLPVGESTVEVQYYFEKDSLVFFETATDLIESGDSTILTTGFHPKFGVKKK